MIVEGSDTGYMLTGLAVAEQRVVVLHNVTVKQGSDSVVSNAVVINQEDPHLVLHTVSGCAVPLVVFEAPAVQVSLDYGQGSVFVCIVNSTKQLVASDSATVQLPTTAIVNITVVEGQGTYTVYVSVNDTAGNQLFSRSYTVDLGGVDMWLAASGIYVVQTQGQVNLTRWSILGDVRSVKAYPPFAVVNYLVKLNPLDFVTDILIVGEGQTDVEVPLDTRYVAVVPMSRNLARDYTVSVSVPSQGVARISLTGSRKETVMLVAAPGLVNRSTYLVWGFEKGAGAGCVQLPGRLDPPPVVLTNNSQVVPSLVNETHVCFNAQDPVMGVAVWSRYVVRYDAGAGRHKFCPGSLGEYQVVPGFEGASGYVVAMDDECVVVDMSGPGRFALVFIPVAPVRWYRSDIMAKYSTRLPLVHYVGSNTWYGFLGLGSGTGALVEVPYASSPQAVYGPVRPTELTASGATLFDSFGVKCGAGGCSVNTHRFDVYGRVTAIGWIYVTSTASPWGGVYVCFDDDDRAPNVAKEKDDRGSFMCVEALARRVDTQNIEVRARVLDIGGGVTYDISRTLQYGGTVVRLLVSVDPVAGVARFFADLSQDPRQAVVVDLGTAQVFVPDLGYIHVGLFGEENARLVGISVFAEVVDSAKAGTGREVRYPSIPIPRVEPVFEAFGPPPPFVYIVLWISVALSAAILGATPVAAAIMGSIAVTFVSMLSGYLFGDWGTAFAVTGSSITLLVVLYALRRAGLV